MNSNQRKKTQELPKFREKRAGTPKHSNQKHTHDNMPRDKRNSRIGYFTKGDSAPGWVDSSTRFFEGGSQDLNKRSPC